MNETLLALILGIPAGIVLWTIIAYIVVGLCKDSLKWIHKHKNDRLFEGYWVFLLLCILGMVTGGMVGVLSLGLLGKTSVLTLVSVAVVVGCLVASITASGVMFLYIGVSGEKKEKQK